MNEVILVAMDRENRTQEELKKNAEYALSAYCIATTHYDISASAAIAVAAAYAYIHSSASAASAAAYHAYAEDSTRFEHWLTLYFDISGEDEQEYINAIKGELK